MPGLTRSSPPFRADHVGSLLRPTKLFEARRQWQEGSLPHTTLRQIEDEAVRSAVALQEACGLQPITDGDFRRNDWFLDFMFSLEGMGRSGAHARVPFSGGVEFQAPIAAVTGRVKCPPQGINVEDFKFLKSVTRRTAKICIPAPAMFYSIIRNDRLPQAVYPDPEDFWKDLGAAYSDAVGHLTRAGATYFQMDDVNSANIGDPKWQSWWAEQGFRPERMVDGFIAVNNAAISQRPKEVTAVIHMCRGNYQSQWTGEGGYDMVAERYFTQSNVDGFFLEYDDARSGGFAPLRFMPKDKIVVLGLITSKRPALESKDEIKRRIDEAAKYVPLERLCLSPQCGFASTQEGNKLTEDEQRRKLTHLVEIATEVWGSA